MSLKRFSAISIAFASVMFAGYLLLRDVMLEKAIGKIQTRIFQKYQARLVIGVAGFEGMARVVLTDVALLPPEGDTLFFCSQSAASFSLLRFIKGQPPVNNIIATEGFIRMDEYADSTSNFSFLLKRESTKTGSSEIKKSPVAFNKMAARLWNRFFGLADFNFNVTNFFIRWKAPSFSEEMSVEQFMLNNTRFIMTATDSTDNASGRWEVNGTVDPHKELLQLNGNSGNGKSIAVPFFEKMTGIRFVLKSFNLSASLDPDQSDAFRINVATSAISPTLHHWRISPEDVPIDSIYTRLSILVDEREIKTGEQSLIVINQLPIYTGFSWLRSDSTCLEVKININDTPAQIFFNSLPKGLFNTLEGIKVNGKLNYHLNFRANLNDPENLVFNSELKKTDFRILSFGKENFAAINGPFNHDVREKDAVVRVIHVGPDNPRYTPLDQISPLLINAVLTAEDGTFRFHRGFNEEAFRQSIATNIKERRFARGGSTITMQLVKNVFLNRNKTVSRKVEEALIVWLIENNYLVTKDRILEIYLNIIEWGPGVYGIGEAADFYFAKHPSQLSLEESIYLSSIIPRPKTFKYTFDKEGKMKEYLKGYFSVVAGRLLKKEIITQAVHDSLQFHIELKGPALQLVLPADSIPVDSLMKEEPEEMF